jgi:hypothetical protein
MAETWDMDAGPFDPDDLVRWATTYGHPEGWAKKAQSLHAENERLREELRIARFDAGVALPEAQERFQRAEADVERLRAALNQKMTAVSRTEPAVSECNHELRYCWCQWRTEEAP